jgi:hypothetical protein
VTTTLRPTLSAATGAGVPVRPGTPTTTGVGMGEVDTPQLQLRVPRFACRPRRAWVSLAARGLWTLLDKRGDRIAVVGLEWARV